MSEGVEEEERWGEVVETNGVEDEGRIWEEVAGGASQTRDIGMGFSSVITAHFSLTFGRKTCTLPLQSKVYFKEITIS